MAETIQSLFDKARALLNIYTEDGIQKPVDDYIDIQSKAVPLADIAHKDIFEMAKLNSEQVEPTTITSFEDVTEVNYKADQAIVYYIAARLAPFKKKELVQYFEDEWLRLRNLCANKCTFKDIEDAYSLGTTVTGGTING
jgi:hypothetical protein